MTKLQEHRLRRAWKKRQRLYKKAIKFYAKSNRLYAKAYKIIIDQLTSPMETDQTETVDNTLHEVIYNIFDAKSDKFRAKEEQFNSEAKKVRAKSKELRSEGDLIWYSAIIAYANTFSDPFTIDYNQNQSGYTINGVRFE